MVQLSGDGDADLYVRKGTAPTTSAYDCRPYLWGSVEACTLENVTGDLHINVRGYDPTSSVQLSAIAQ